jgi:hypothetical protein
LVVASLAHRREGDTREKNGLQPSSGLRRREGGRHAPEDVVAPTQGDTGAGAAAVGKEETDTWRGVAWGGRRRLQDGGQERRTVAGVWAGAEEQKGCRGRRKGKRDPGTCLQIVKVTGTLQKTTFFPTNLGVFWEKVQHENCRVFQALHFCFKTQIQKLKVCPITKWILNQGKMNLPLSLPNQVLIKFLTFLHYS